MKKLGDFQVQINCNGWYIKRHGSYSAGQIVSGSKIVERMIVALEQEEKFIKYGVNMPVCEIISGGTVEELKEAFKNYNPDDEPKWVEPYNPIEHQVIVGNADLLSDSCVSPAINYETPSVNCEVTQANHETPPVINCEVQPLNIVEALVTKTEEVKPETANTPVKSVKKIKKIVRKPREQ
jgi:hypothetical protein